MELRAYLDILRRKWWIVIPIFLVTVTCGIVFTYTRTPVYSATATYVVVPGSAFSDVRNFTDGLDLLGRREEIAATFSEIASSRTIKEGAMGALSLSSQSDEDYSINSKLRAGTNIMEITAEAPDPVSARDLANAVGTRMEDYVRGMYEVFVLVPLDEAIIPEGPTSPNKPLNFGLSVVLGLALSVGLAFFSQYLETPLNPAVSVNILDDETGVYNREYFLQRLAEEIVRARRNRHALSLSLLRVDNLSLIKGAHASQLRAEMLRQVAMLANQYLREEDIVARLDNDVLAMLLPDTTGENAKALMEYLQTRIAWTPFQSSTHGAKFNFKGIIGITAYNHNGTSRDELIAKANRALQLAEVDDNGGAYLMVDHEPESE
jgi:diguanylate cyclase (GGDEF)-like protein